MGREVSNLWQQMASMEQALCTTPEGERHEDSEQHRVFCDDRFCIEKGPLQDDEPVRRAA